MPIKICEDNNIHNIKYIRNNVKKKCPKFLRQNFGASLVFSISNHLTCRLSSAKCLELNIYTMLLWVFTKLYLILTSVLPLKDFVVKELRRTADSYGWRASSAPRTYWGLVILSLYPPRIRNYWSSPMPFCVMAKWNSAISLLAAPPSESESNEYLHVRRVQYD
jgi:hypothetical protein